VPHPCLIIGIGNRDRGDDAVGRIVADQLRERVQPPAAVIESDGEATGLVDRLGTADTAILVDAALSGGPPGSIRRFDVADGLPQLGRVGLSTHGFGLAEAIELAQIFGRLPRRCIVFAVEARSFAIGDPLSREVADAVEATVVRVLEEAAALTREAIHA